MTAEPAGAFWESVRTLFHATADRTPEERAPLLCACNDAELRAEVERLLNEHDEGSAFLDQSVWELVETADAKWEHVRIGPYRVVRKLGHGGMGSVFLAVREDDQFEQRVAIKLVRRDAASDALL